MNKSVRFIVIGVIGVVLIFVIGFSLTKKEPVPANNESSSEIIAETTTAIQEVQTVQQEETTTEKTEKKIRKRNQIKKVRKQK